MMIRYDTLLLLFILEEHEKSLYDISILGYILEIKHLFLPPFTCWLGAFLAGLSGVGEPRSERRDPAVKVKPTKGKWRPEKAAEGGGGGTASDNL